MKPNNYERFGKRRPDKSFAPSIFKNRTRWIPIVISAIAAGLAAEGAGSIDGTRVDRKHLLGLKELSAEWTVQRWRGLLWATCEWRIS